jgi:hypothetical protein
MANRFIMTDGLKSTGLLFSDDPGVWNYFSNAPKSSRAVLYGYVAAVFRAYNLKANTVGNMPFVLFRGKREYDNSATWENKVGFLPNPSELFRLNTLSYIDANAIYNIQTSDALGYKPRGLYSAIPSTFNPITDPMSTQLQYIERQVGTLTERYGVDGNGIQNASGRLVYLWRLDHTTEVLPSPNTEALAIQNAAEQVLYTDSWIKHYFKRGGIKPTLIAMKGLIDRDSKDEKEKSWGDWLRGLGRYISNPARIYNAEALDVKPFGDGVAELKDNHVYRQALENIAMGTGMPLSLLLANSANYATAKEEKRTWYENDIIPLCNWMAYEYNRQVFEPIGLRLEFKPETLDPNQDDETKRAQALTQFIAFLNACPTFGIFKGSAETFGFELSDMLLEEAEKFYADKEKKAEEIREQMGQAGVITDPDGKPIQVQGQAEPGEKEEEEPDEKDDEQADEQRKPPAKWLPSLDELETLREWRAFALRSYNKGKPYAERYNKAAGRLPDAVIDHVVEALGAARTDAEITAAFQVEEVKAEVAPQITDAATVLEGIRLGLEALAATTK